MARYLNEHHEQRFSVSYNFLYTYQFDVLVKRVYYFFELKLKNWENQSFVAQEKKNFTYGHIRKLLQLGNVCENARLYFLLKLLAKHFIILVLMISHSTVNDHVYRTLFTW